MRRSTALRGFVTKEARHILRDRQTLFVLLVLPLAQVLLFGAALRTDVRDVRLVVVDPTPDHVTRALVQRFAATERYQIVGTLPSTAQLASWFERGAADQVIVFPPGFASRTGSPQGAELLVVTDASDPNTGSTMQSYASAIVERFTQEQRLRAGALTIVPQVQMRFNPTLESANLFVPGLIALVLTLVSALMAAISMAREKERGTLEVLLVSPLRPWQIIVGKVAPYLVLGFINVFTVLLAARLVFDVPMRGSYLLLLAQSGLFILVSLGLGVVIAARTASQRTAMMGALVGLLVPTTVLSGMVFPLTSMPVVLQWFAHLVPAKWFILISRGIMLRGVGLEQLWMETLVLATMAAMLLVVAVRSFDVRLA